MRKILFFILILVIQIAAQTNLKSQIAYKPVSKFFVLEDSTLNNFRTSHSVLNISFQVIAGEGMGFVSVLVPLAIAGRSAFSENSSNSTTDIALLLTIPAYIIGTATGVHWVAHLENKDHSYWKNVGFTAIGGGIGLLTGLVLGSKYHKIPPAGIITMALAPLAGSLAYTLFIADWPKKPVPVTKFDGKNFEENGYLVKDIVQRSQIIKMNLLRIEL